MALLTTPLFWFTSLDIDVARLFFAPNTDEPWPLGQHPLVRLFYDTAPMVAGALATGSVAIIIVSYLTRAARRWRRQAAYVLLVLLVGPGLLVNGLFKEHWDRARPRQIVEFGGAHAYSPPVAIGAHDSGKAFPSGHASALFATIAIWYLLRRRRGAPATFALATVTVAGTCVGLARMAAGAHFLSDVLWSAIVTSAVALALYQLLRLHQRGSEG